MQYHPLSLQSPGGRRIESTASLNGSHRKSTMLDRLDVVCFVIPQPSIRARGGGGGGAHMRCYAVVIIVDFLSFLYFVLTSSSATHGTLRYGIYPCTPQHIIPAASVATRIPPASFLLLLPPSPLLPSSLWSPPPLGVALRALGGFESSADLVGETRHNQTVCLLLIKCSIRNKRRGVCVRTTYTNTEFRSLRHHRCRLRRPPHQAPTSAATVASRKCASILLEMR